MCECAISLFEFGYKAVLIWVLLRVYVENRPDFRIEGYWPLIVTRFLTDVFETYF